MLQKNDFPPIRQNFRFFAVEIRARRLYPDNRSPGGLRNTVDGNGGIQHEPELPTGSTHFYPYTNGKRMGRW